MEKGEYLDAILRSKKTVFSVKDVALLWGEAGTGATRVRLNYYVMAGKLIRVRRGVYVKDMKYDRFELATAILKPSYVSFETVLGLAGVTFQYYGQIFVASYAQREITCDGQEYAFQTIKYSTLVNPKGVDQSREYSVASKERAFLDTVYRSKDYFFDNLSPLDWDAVFDILPIYDNESMTKKVQNYYKSNQTTEKKDDAPRTNT